MTVDPLDLEQFHPALRLALEEGKSYKGKPVLSHHQVYTQMKHVTKPKSSVPGDIPRKLIQEFTYEFAKPATRIFNEIIQSAQWPSQWKVEETVVLSKTKTKLPQSEEDLCTISKTPWFLKVLENILADIILPVVDKYLDPVFNITLPGEVAGLCPQDLGPEDPTCRGHLW